MQLNRCMHRSSNPLRGAAGRARTAVWSSIRIAAILAALVGCGGGTVQQDDAGADVVTPPAPPVVATRSGPVRGTRDDDGMHRFFGIPYAAPPVGPLRFRPPQEAQPWTEELDASEPRAFCPQRSSPLLPPRGAQQEDCLELNVFTPELEPTTPLPVLVFVHGGAFTIGGGNPSAYDGERLARRGAVVVTINYRLGLLGFLAHPALDAEAEGSSGMYGLLDQQAALRWVRDNIAAFGGDPARVALFGESAGAISVCHHYVMPGSRGLFASAISQSGVCLRGPTAPASRTAARDRGVALATALGCPGTDAAAAACLRALPDTMLVEAIGGLRPATEPDTGYGILAIGPNVDGVVLPDTPDALFAASNHAAVPYILGTNLDEGTFFSDDDMLTSPESYEAMVSWIAADRAETLLANYPVASFETPLEAYDVLFRDVVFLCPTRMLARTLTATGHDVYAYQLVQTNATADALGFGVMHGLDLLYLFGNYEPPFTRPTDAEARVRDAMQGAWTRFAASGDPNGDGVAWPVFDESEPYLSIGDPLTTVTALERTRCDAIDP
jgi:para-nitrobenzyl esterase